MAIPQLPNLLLQPRALPLRVERLRRDALRLGVREAVDDEGAEYGLETAHDVAFDDLRGDVGYECFLLHLGGGLVGSSPRGRDALYGEGERRWQNVDESCRDWTNLVDGK
jgi:hypothetical protein